MRQIESKSTRTVHFIFDHGLKSKITPFAKKYDRLLEGNLKQFEDQQHEQFEAFV